MTTGYGRDENSPSFGALKMSQLKTTSGGKEDEGLFARDTFARDELADVSRVLFQIEKKDDPRPIVLYLVKEIEASLGREVFLKDHIDTFLNDNAKFIMNRIEELKGQQAESKNEVERWMMRNEELEQRILMAKQETQNFGDLMRQQDNVVRALLKQKQQSDMLKGAMMSELNSKADFLQIELERQGA
jgi:hypothetical protein